MTGGDTLIVKNGTYSGQKIHNPPSGSAGAYTVIKAENDGGAIVTDINYGTGFMLHINGDYIQVEGLKFVGNATDGGIEGAYISGSYNKVFRCGFVVTPCTQCSNKSNVIISGTYNLVEDSWAYGAGRYKFLLYGGDALDSGAYNILRRVIARHDREYSGGFNPQAPFANYQGKNNLFQNCLVVDSNQTAYYDGNAWRGPFFLEKGQKGGSVTISGTLSLNNAGPFVYDSASGDDSDPMYTAGNLMVSNSTSVGGSFIGSYWVRSLARTTMSVDHSAIGNIPYEVAGEPGGGAGFRGGVDAANNYAKATNSIFYGLGMGALYNVRGANNYNTFYGNSANYGDSSTAGANDKTNVNPLTTSFLYPVRVEAGSPLKGAGAGGSDIGPTILKRIGVSGTLYGETGYNTVTADNLWPWPNENRIKADMSAYPTNWPANGLPSPLRGFTTGVSKDGSAQTLTKYIWEYLGNQIPSDIYGGTPAPVNGTCGSASGQSFSTLNSGSANLCAAGTVASFAGTGPWTWGCNGSNGGTNTANNACSTSRTQTPSGNIYYVRPDGHDTASGANNTGNTTTGAWLTLQKAANTMVAGDTVMVADGTYAGFYIETSGTSTLPITYKAIGSGANITSRNSRTTDNINIESWTGTPADYITIDGFNVYNATRMGIRAIAGTGIIIQNCTSHNNSSNGIFTGDTPGIQILNNTVYANGSTSMEHNIYISNALSDGAIVRGNVIRSSNTGNGLQLNGDWEMGGDGFIDNAVVENNVVYSNRLKGLSLISIRYGRIQNNIIYNNGPAAGGIHLVDQAGQNFSTGNTVVNNTVDEPGQASIRVNAGSDNNVIFNNICVGTTGIVFEGSGNYQSNNYISASGTGIFANYAGHDYHQATGSLSINSGLSTFRSVTPPSVDIVGTSRPQSGVFDLGAYESSPAGGDTTAPVISAFTMPVTATSLIVSVSSFTATDAVGVTGYMITENFSAPAIGATGWSATAPTTFTFSGSGARNAYAWAKDAAGNVSTSMSRSVSITLSDSTAPTVSISSPAAGAKLKGSVTLSATASDNVRVTNVDFYLDGVHLGADGSAPYSLNWNTVSVASGTHNLTAKAYDAAGHVTTSNPVSVTLRRIPRAPTITSVR